MPGIGGCPGGNWMTRVLLSVQQPAEWLSPLSPHSWPLVFVAWLAGTNAMPHFEQLSGLSDTISGCMGHV